MSAIPDRFIACGMYAFTPAQRTAWQRLFDRFLALSGLTPAQVPLVFDHDPATLLNPGLWFGHTCGYPLMTRLKDRVAPFALPLFDVQGTAGKLYSSRFVVAAGSAFESIADCRDRVAAVNNPDSNSGMNVLRHAVAEIGGGNRFFADVVTTGGHFDSLRAVASGAADVAAIDCVSYRLIADWQPDLVARVRVLGDSVSSCGLPLVMPHALLADTDAGALVGRLEQALAAEAEAVRGTLHLAGFDAVTLDDYRGIVEIEQYAVGRGYPELR